MVFDALYLGSKYRKHPYEGSMTERDLENLQFLLTVSPKVLAEWLEQADEDDIDYAMELLNYAKTELIVHEMERNDSVENVDEAKKELDRIFGKAV